MKPFELEFGFLSEQMLEDQYQTTKWNQICILMLNEGESLRKEKCLLVKHATFCSHRSSCTKKVGKLILQNVLSLTNLAKTGRYCFFSNYCKNTTQQATMQYS